MSDFLSVAFERESIIYLLIILEERNITYFREYVTQNNVYLSIYIYIYVYVYREID